MFLIGLEDPLANMMGPVLNILYANDPSSDDDVVTKRLRMIGHTCRVQKKIKAPELLKYKSINVNIKTKDLKNIQKGIL